LDGCDSSRVRGVLEEWILSATPFSDINHAETRNPDTS
jgi:hypothetical protein